MQSAAGLLKTLSVGTEEELTHKQRQQALVIIEQVQNNCQSTLLDVVNALLTVPAQNAFAVTIQKSFIPN